MVLAAIKPAAQLYGEMKEFFPENAVGISSPTMTTISRKRMCQVRIRLSKKDASVNEHIIEQMRFVGSESVA